MGQTCDTDRDCTNGYLSCNGNKVCGCWHEQGAALDEHGMCPWTSTWQAKTHFVLACIAFIMSILVLAYHTYATWLVLHMGANGAVRKFAFCLEVAVLGWTAINALLVVWYSDPSLLGARTTETVNTIIWFLWGPRTAIEHTYRMPAAALLSLSTDLECRQPSPASLALC